MKHRQRGYSLVEVLITISLMGAFLLLAYRLLGSNFQFQAATRQANNDTARLDDALRRLRADVAESRSISSHDATALHINGAQPIDWHFSQGQLTRRLAGRSSSWEIGQPVHFNVEGALLLVSVDSDQPIAMGRLP